MECFNENLKLFHEENEENEENEFDYSSLITKIMKNFPASSIDLIVSETKKYFSNEDYDQGCFILSLTNTFFN
jgi:hypothetical protein